MAGVTKIEGVSADGTASTGLQKWWAGIYPTLTAAQVKDTADQALATANDAESKVSAAVASQDSATAQNINTGTNTQAAGDARWARSTAAPKTYVSTGASDETAGVQAFLNALAAGDDALLVGTLNISTITISKANVRVRLAPGAVLAKIGSTSDTYVSGGTSGPSFTDTVKIAAAGVVFEGGTITMPAVWDGTNDGSTGDAACSVIRVSASKVTVRGVTINNVPKNGIIVSNVDDAQVTGCRIYGNFPVAAYTGTNTGQFGIKLDPVASTVGGAALVENNHIRTCVQGVILANLGAAAPGYGYIIAGNNFQGCHNHGIYQQDGVGTVIDGNTFYTCQTPIVCSGQGVSVTGNTLYTSTTGGNDDMTGISGRDLVDSVIAGNTIVGDSTATNVGIAVDSVYATNIARVVVADNILDLAGPGGKPGIRVGTSTTSTMTGVRIVNNVVRAPGITGGGVIHVSMASNSYGYGNTISHNTVTVTGNSHGILVAQQRASRVNENTIRNEYSSSGAATTLIHIDLLAVTSSSVKNNTSYNPSGFGTNCTLRSVQADAGSTGNILGPTNTLYESGLAGYAALVDSGSGNLHGVDIGSATAAPSTGTWAAGTRLTNSAPAVGSPKGWLCTAAGTPGTWVSEGNL